MEKKRNKTMIIILLIVVILLFIVSVVGAFFIYKYQESNQSIGTEWGDTYYSYLQSVKEADEEKIKSAGLSKDITTAQIQFIQVENENNPKMVLTYQKDDEKYTNVYYIEDEKKVNVITYSNPTTLKLLYNRDIKEYKWYVYSKEDDINSYKSLEKNIKEAKNGNVANSVSQEPEVSYADYTFKDSELEFNFEVAEGEIPTMSKFDETFIEVELDESNLVEINFEEKDKELKKELIKIVGEYKTKEDIITEEFKTRTEEKEATLKNREEEIKQLEEKKKQEEEVAKKKNEEKAKKKAEEAVKANTVQIGKYTLKDTSRDGALTIKNATDSSIQFDISVVNLFGGNHMGQLSATATKTSDNKYVYTTTQYGKTYKFYMEVSGNSVKVSTSKMINGDGFDPFCGVNAVFDGTYAK